MRGEGQETLIGSHTLLGGEILGVSALQRQRWVTLPRDFNFPQRGPQADFCLAPPLTPLRKLRFLPRPSKLLVQ